MLQSSCVICVRRRSWIGHLSPVCLSIGLILLKSCPAHQNTLFSKHYTIQHCKYSFCCVSAPVRIVYRSSHCLKITCVICSVSCARFIINASCISSKFLMMNILCSYLETNPIPSAKLSSLFDGIASRRTVDFIKSIDWTQNSPSLKSKFNVLERINRMKHSIYSELIDTLEFGADGKFEIKVRSITYKLFACDAMKWFRMNGFYCNSFRGILVQRQSVVFQYIGKNYGILDGIQIKHGVGHD